MTLVQRELVDVRKIAERLGVQVDTVHTWRKRTKRGESVFMPDNVDFFGNIPVWDWTDVLVWAGRTGRLGDAAPEWREQFARLEGHAPGRERPGPGTSAVTRAAVARPVKRRRRPRLATS